jgi:hypothetical protein
MSVDLESIPQNHVLPYTKKGMHGDESDGSSLVIAIVRELFHPKNVNGAELYFNQNTK